jgi:hypothetical protein
MEVKMSDEIKSLVERLREDYEFRVSIVSLSYRETVSRLPVEAADVIEQQAAKIATLEQTLREIANADTVEWDDPTEFEAWAKSRARHSLAAERGDKS